MDADIQKLCDFLEQLLNGSLPYKEANATIETLSALRRPDLEELYGNLFHYMSDDDIRKRDPRYKEFQGSEMKKLICRLQTGDFTKANVVTFLKKT